MSVSATARELPGSTDEQLGSYQIKIIGKFLCLRKTAYLSITAILG